MKTTKIIVCLLFWMTSVYSQSQNKNYIQIATPTVATSTVSGLNGLPSNQVLKQINYSDGLGRTIQSNIVQFTDDYSGNDLVQPVEYNYQGQQVKSFLPFVSSSSTGEYVNNYTSEQATFYNNEVNVAHDNKPYSEVLTDQSPLNRTIEASSPGNVWALGFGHTKKVVYDINSANDIYKWTLNYSSGMPSGASGVFAGSNVYFKTTYEDENGNRTIKYSDQNGLTICLQQEIYTDVNDKTRDFTNGGVSQSGGSEKVYSKYQIYDNRNRLIYEIPIQAVKLMVTANQISFTDNPSTSDAVFKQYITAFHYDERGNLIEKHDPSLGWQYFIYNSNNMLVLSQDPKLRASNKWNFVKYDKLARMIETGMTVDTRTRSDIQPAMYGATTQLFETRDNSTNGYSNVALPTASLEINLVNYYDNYDFSFDATLSGRSYVSYGGVLNSTRVLGMPTASKARILGTTNYLYSLIYYDEDSRPIQVQKQNQLSGAMIWDIVNNEYSFAGQVLKSVRRHNYSSLNPVIITTEYLYDHVGRMTDIFKQVNSETRIHYVYNKFNRLGQVIRKDLHYDSNYPSNYLQRLDYRYNIRGWLTNINNARLENDYGLTNEDDNDVFGEELNYDREVDLNTDFFVKPQYNGLISAFKWRTKPYTTSSISFNFRPSACYAYRYDDMYRLTAAYYAQNNNTDPLHYFQSMHLYDEKESYRLDGNISDLQRNASNSGAVTIVDNLIYEYQNNGMQLNKVTDLTSGNILQNEFKDLVNSSNEYRFDTNGNLDFDENKGLSTSYNFMNLPETVTDGAATVTYTYDATGRKIKMLAGGIQTEYIDGIEYVSGAIKSIATEEGIIRPKSSIASNVDTYVYDYLIKDHLGNVRVVLTNEVIEKKYLATMELQNSSAEELLFDNIPSTRDDKPALMPADNSYSPDEKVSLLDPSLNRAIGHAKVLSVNGGDVVSIDTKYYFTSGSFVQPTTVVVQDILTQLAAIFFPGFGTTTLPGEQQAQAETMFTQNVPFNDFLTNLFSESLIIKADKPLAFLTYIMLDKEFNMIPEATGVLRAENSDQLSDLAVLELKIPKDGFLYIYVSNQSTGKEVSFDNLDIKHVPGNVLEENHYYPYGLLIEQLSSKNPNFVSQSNQKYQSKQLRDELSMNMLDFGARQYDAVLGRWIVQDPMRQYSNPYLAMGNNPSNMVDPNGMNAYSYGVTTLGYGDYSGACGGGGASFDFQAGPLERKDDILRLFYRTPNNTNALYVNDGRDRFILASTLFNSQQREYGYWKDSYSNSHSHAKSKELGTVFVTSTWVSYFTQGNYFAEIDNFEHEAETDITIVSKYSKDFFTTPGLKMSGYSTKIVKQGHSAKEIVVNSLTGSPEGANIRMPFGILSTGLDGSWTYGNSIIGFGTNMEGHIMVDISMGNMGTSFEYNPQVGIDNMSLIGVKLRSILPFVAAGLFAPEFLLLP